MKLNDNGFKEVQQKNKNEREWREEVLKTLKSIDEKLDNLNK